MEIMTLTVEDRIAEERVKALGNNAARTATETYDLLKSHGLIKQNTFDIPLMSRLSSKYSQNESTEKLAAKSEFGLRK